MTRITANTFTSSERLRDYNSDRFIAILERERVIKRVRRGVYRFNMIGVGTPAQTTGPRARVFAEFGVASRFDNNGYERYRLNMTQLIGRERIGASTTTTTQTAPPRDVLRTIRRYGYHSQSRNVQAALDRITADSDGVKRSFGLEYEINYLTATQEDKLARLLDNLPAHTAERDGSLSSAGVEIIFEPMGEADLKKTWKTLTEFVNMNSVDMGGTGAHITYGVSNSTSTRYDIQIRANRLALAVKSISTVQTLRRVFGRDFSGYCELPRTLTANHHTNAFSLAGRNSTCWECRLINWKADIDVVVQFLTATEAMFHRPFNSQDFMAIFNILDDPNAPTGE